MILRMYPQSNGDLLNEPGKFFMTHSKMLWCYSGNIRQFAGFFYGYVKIFIKHDTTIDYNKFKSFIDLSDQMWAHGPKS